MSEQAAERPGGGGNLLEQRLGPLATWVWLLIATLLIGAYYLYARRKQGAAGSTAAAPGATANASQVPDIILQDYAAPVTQSQAVTVPPAGSVPPPQPPPKGTPPPHKPTGPGPLPVPPKPAAPPKGTPPPSPVFNGSYTVKKGQTLAEVARLFGITREQLAHANGFGTGAGLRTGQVLKVPSPAPAGKPNKAP